MLRSLERYITWHEVQFDGGQSWHQASPEEADRVRHIVGEADHPDYWFSASKDGNRETHYRGPPRSGGLRQHLSPIAGQSTRFTIHVSQEAHIAEL